MTEFATPSANSFPDGITVGADGNLWFTERSGNNIGRITTAGVITEFAVPIAASEPRKITAGAGAAAPAARTRRRSSILRRPTRSV